MRVFVHDGSFDGVLAAVFDAYSRRAFPDMLLRKGEALPLFCDDVCEVHADEAKADRVWRALQKKLSPSSLASLVMCWFSEQPGSAEWIFRYVCKVMDSSMSIEGNWADKDVRTVLQWGKKVASERERLLQFLRFQKMADGVFFAAVEPLYNVLPLAVSHFRDRFSDQAWLVYDVRRGYGFYYDRKAVEEVSFPEPPKGLRGGWLDPSLAAEDERLFQDLWKTYFQSVAIKERKNARLQKQNMPVRFWKYLVEKR